MPPTKVKNAKDPLQNMMRQTFLTMALAANAKCAKPDTKIDPTSKQIAEKIQNCGGLNDSAKKMISEVVELMTGKPLPKVYGVHHPLSVVVCFPDNPEGCESNKPMLVLHSDGTGMTYGSGMWRLPKTRFRIATEAETKEFFAKVPLSDLMMKINEYPGIKAALDSN